MQASSPAIAGLRRVTDADADGLTAIVGAAYDEHPGCVLDLPGIDADLTAPGTTASRRGSPWWVVDRPPADGTGPSRIVASIGCGPVDGEGAVELKRLYVAATHRGRGLATQLVDLVERQAAGVGARCVELWSDTRFTDAHRRYETLGYERTGEHRRLHDPSDTTEWRFVKPVVPTPRDRVVAWTGPFGHEEASLTVLPDGWHLTSSVAGDGLDAGPVVAEVETDAAWVTTRARVVHGAATRVLTADGHGRWWRDDAPAPDLAGCVDVDVEATPLTNTLPIRRLLAADAARHEAHEVTAAWLRVPGPAVEPLQQSYTRHDDGRWTYRSAGGFEAELIVDDDGLVASYGDLWSRA